AAISVGVAEPVLSSMTETRYCIRDHLLWFRGRPSWATAAPLLRTPLPRSDMPPGSRARCSCPYAVFRGGQMSSDTVSLLDGDTFVVCDRRGDVVPSGSEPHGLFLQDTRFLSCWRLTVDGSSPKVLSTDDVNYFSAQFFLVPPAESHYDQASFSIMRKRSVGRGFHEDIAVLNHTTEPLDLVLQIEADADFADLFEVKDALDKKGEHYRSVTAGRLVLGYRREGFVRETWISATADEADATDHGLRFRLRIEPQGEWTTCVDVAAARHAFADVTPAVKYGHG